MHRNVQPPDALPKGAHLKGGRYVITQVLGAGGFGVTYLAGDSSLKRIVAIKELFPTGCERSGRTVTLAGGFPRERWAKAVEMFLREAVTLAAIDHGGVVPIYDYFDENNSAYMVMKFIDGKPLHRLVAESGPLSVERTLKYMAAVGNALEVVHRAGVLHRDIKPSNIIITRQDLPVLIDFGAARSFVAGAGAALTSIFTFGFSPQEQFFPHLGQGTYTDVYGLAATCFYLLTGGTPDSGALDENSRLPLTVRRALSRALIHDGRQRTQTVSALLSELFDSYQMIPDTQVRGDGAGRWPATPERPSEPYQIKANGITPALIVYLLDVSASMNGPLGDRRRIEVVAEALEAAVRQMVFRSTRGTRIAPRYRLAIYGYSDDVRDLLGGIKSVSEVAQVNLPQLTTMRTTETAKAFVEVERLLIAQLPNLQDCPAPLVCHMTDGEYTGADPEPIVRRIKQLAVPDGNVLVENIFISDTIISSPIDDPHQWPGILPTTPLENSYARKLQALSSPIPESYRIMMLESDYHLAPGALMMLPGISPELVTLGFQMSAATPIR